MRPSPRALVLVPILLLTAPPPHAAADPAEVGRGAPSADLGQAVGPGRETPPALPGATIRVPLDAATIQEAVDRAEPGGLVLVSAGVYREAVVVATPFITIRGIDRNEVILDGGFELRDGIRVIEADGVAVENLTVRDYLLSGISWTRVFGYRASYVTTYNDGRHGLAASGSRFGQFDHAYASGHPVAGISIDRCGPCDAVVTGVLAENNGRGFSGTNASGRLLVVNSRWRRNMAGIVQGPTSLEGGTSRPDAVIAGNLVHDNNNDDAPAEPSRSPALGIGIMLDGGRDTLVTENLVIGHENFGIAILPSPDQGLRLPSGNVVRDNQVGSSGDADIALGWPTAGGDCFAGNRFSSSLPPSIQWRHGCGSWLRPMAGGDPGVLAGPLARLLRDGGAAGDWRSQPPPPRQASMPGAEGAPPDPAIAESAVPEPVHIRDARALEARASSDVPREVTVLGAPIVAGWFGVLIGLYAYALPLILYSAWVSIAVWDLVRQEAVPNGVRVGWMAGVLAIPLAGPVAYYAFGRSPIQPSLRLALVGGGLAFYAVVTILGVVLGAA